LIIKISYVILNKFKPFIFIENIIFIMQIKFYKTGDKCDFFSNVTNFPINVNLGGNQYKFESSEGLYQATKGIHNPHLYSSTIQQLQGTIGANAQKIGTQIKNALFMRDTTKPIGANFSEKLMYEVLLIKATQHPAIINALLRSGNAEIIEDAGANDDFWGNGANGKGRNALGKAWEKVRETFKAELASQGKIDIRYGFSKEICDQLKINFATNSNGQLSQAQIDAAANNKFNSDIDAFITSAPAPHSVMPNASVKDYITYNDVAKDSKSALKRFFEAAKNNNFSVTSLKIDNDLNNLAKKVAKINFVSPAEASKFAQNFNASVVQGNLVIIGEDKLQYVCNKFGIPKHGFANPHDTAKSMIFDYGSLYSNHMSVVQPTPPVTQHIYQTEKFQPGIEKFLNSIKNHHFNAQNINVAPDLNIQGKKVLKVKFDSTLDAQNFAKEVKAIFSNDIVILGENKVEYICDHKWTELCGLSKDIFTDN
jgi:ribA/ribD-fused uncharacterized protein